MEYAPNAVCFKWNTCAAEGEFNTRCIGAADEPCSTKLMLERMMFYIPVTDASNMPTVSS